MATPRWKLVDQHTAYAYHLVSNCVRRGFLCGKDHTTGKDYSHRKRWIENRIIELARHFAVEVYAFAIMSNHFHLVVVYDPKAANRWPPEMVARRWSSLCPVRTRRGTVNQEATMRLETELLSNPQELEKKRAVLGSLSHFMKFLKQPIAYRANKEDGCKGHFFEQRFYSGVLLDETALLQAMTYSDLNPDRTRSSSNSLEIDCTGVLLRLRELKTTAEDVDTMLRQTIRPLATGLDTKPIGLRPTFSLQFYLSRVRSYARAVSSDRPTPRERKWLEALSLFRNRQRAYGRRRNLHSWLENRGFSIREAHFSGSYQ